MTSLLVAQLNNEASIFFSPPTIVGVGVEAIKKNRRVLSSARR